jgi:hypothetical protein
LSADSPRVQSFVLRFVQDAPQDGAASAPAWRGVIVNVQSNTEVNFTEFADAVAFIARDVPLGEFSFGATNDERSMTNDVRPSSSVVRQLGE